MKLMLYSKDEVYLRNITDAEETHHPEEINGENYLSFVTYEEVFKKERIMYRDPLNDWHEFIIEDIYSSKENGKMRYEVYAEHSIYETFGDYIDVLQVTDAGPKDMLGQVLGPSRWVAGTVTAQGTQTYRFAEMSVREAIQEVALLFQAELRFKITRVGNIINRSVDLVPQRGYDLGKRFTYSKDLISVSKKIHQDNVVTALYGYGKELEPIPGGEDLPRQRLTFEDINAGVRYVEDTAAKEMWGRGPTNDKKNNFDKVIFENCEDKAELLSLTTEALEKIKDPKVSYEAKVIDLKALGFEHEGVGLGDVVTVIDKEFVPPLRLKSRIIRIEKDLLNPENNLLLFGNFTPNMTKSWVDIAEWMEDFRERSHIWDRAETINPDGTIDVDWFENLVAGLNQEMNARGGYVYFSDQGEGIMTLDAPEDANPSMAIQIKGGMFRIAANKLPNGEWNWRTFGDGQGFYADAFIGGVLKGGQVEFDLTMGTLLIGNSVADHTLWFDGNTLSIKMRNGNTLEEEFSDVVDYVDTEVVDLSLLLSQEDFEALKRELVTTHREVAIRYNNTYSNPLLTAAGIDSSQKQDLYNSFQHLGSLYHDLMLDLDHLLGQFVAGQWMISQVRLKTPIYLDYIEVFNNVQNLAIDYINLSSEEKMDILQGQADDAMDELIKFQDDKYHTPAEKRRLWEQVEVIKMEKDKITNQASDLGLSVYAYNQAYNALVPYMETYILIDMDETTYTGGYLISLFTDYYDEKMKLLTGINNKINAKVEVVEVDVTRAERVAADAADAANDAAYAANLATASVTDIASDNKVIPKEKKELKKEWDIIYNEYTKLITEANWYNVGTSTYRSYYNALNTYITPILSNMTTTSTVDRNTLIARFVNYYDARQSLLNSVSSTTSSALDGKANKSTLRSEINANQTGVKIQGTNINLVGAVNVLSNIAGDLGTITAGTVNGITLNGNSIVGGTINIGSQALRVYSDGELRAGRGGFRVPPDGDGVYNNFADAQAQIYGARWKYNDSHYIFQNDKSITFYQVGGRFMFQRLENSHHGLRMGYTQATASWIKALSSTGKGIQIRNGYDSGYNPIDASDFVTGSSRTFKNDIRPTESKLDMVRDTQVYTFTHKVFGEDGEEQRITMASNEPKQEYTGFISEEAPSDITADLGDGKLGISLSSTVGVLWKAIQELSSEVDMLKTKMVELENKKE